MEDEITLGHGAWRAVVSPFGASLRRFYQILENGDHQDIVWGYHTRASKQGGQGDVLIPYPNRVKDGRYAFEGNTYQLPINDKTGPNSIHGFLRGVFWQIESRAANSVTFRYELRKEQYAEKGYPFSLDVRLHYVLDASGLSVKFDIHNVGQTNAPVGVGFHPYFVIGTDSIDEAELKVAARSFLEPGPYLIPTGKELSVKNTTLDFRSFAPIGPAKIDHCFSQLIADADGMIRVHLRNSKTKALVTLQMDAVFKYFVVYTGDTIPPPQTRKAIALEPMTCAPNGFNGPDRAAVVLGAAQSFGAGFKIVYDRQSTEEILK